MAAEIEAVVLRYPFESEWTQPAAGAGRLRLAASLSAVAPPYLFEGSFEKPRIAAGALLVLAKLAGTRFHTPPNMVAQILAAADPVITCSDDLLRFESLSQCASAYARLDVPSDACSGEFIARGTTNVDFNQPLRNALSAITGEGNLQCTIGTKEITLETDGARFVERKVALPTRWLRSFAEVSALQSSMQLAFTINKVNTIRFLQSLTGTNSTKAEYFIVERRGELVLTQKASAGAVKVCALSRLKALTPLAPLIDKLSVYTNASGDATSWV